VSCLFDGQVTRSEIPALSEFMRGKPLAYLDNAATTLKPEAVISVMATMMRRGFGNVHRGVHELSESATLAFEGARAEVARFIGASRPSEIIFTRGATEGINLVAQALTAPRSTPSLCEGDLIAVSEMEHHSNIVPWQMAAERSGARVVKIPMLPSGDLDWQKYVEILAMRPRVVAFTHVSNALGTRNPIEKMIAAAREAGSLTLIDGAQGVTHEPVDVEKLGCDFYVFSGHKIYGPTGIGVLYGRERVMRQLSPWQGGGDMIRTVSFEGSTWADLPARFEAGTPAIVEAVGLATALHWVTELGRERLVSYESRLMNHLLERLSAEPKVRLIGSPERRVGSVSFQIEGVHPHDAGTLLDECGVAVRVGHHCAQPVMRHFGVPATIRASVAAYTSHDDIERLMEGISYVRKVFHL
jgi:cysteine desulfurase/selenocysteine lyase